jgi:phosphatidylinositol glycan class B
MARPGDVEGERRFLGAWLGFSLLCLVVAAWRSTGDYHPDEQFQTLEFAAAKLGLTPVTALPWEHSARMRSWLQPGLYVLVVSALRRLSGNPFVWATGLRLVSALLGWAAIAGLARCCGAWIEDAGSRRVAVRMLCAFCLLPVVLVRTSSESLATSSFLLGLAVFGLGRDRDRPASGAVFAAGVLFGLAFEFRFPVGLMVAGWFAWAVLVGRRSPRELVTAGLGTAMVLALAAPVDRWGYGEWCFPPWNYVVENLRAGGAADRFGSLPVWGYLDLVLRLPFGPATSLAAAATGVAWLRHPRHVLTWCGLPMLLMHSLIGHKELRFLFPLLPSAAVSFGLAAAPAHGRLERLASFWRGASSRRLRRALFGANAVALLALCLVPLSPRVELQRFVFEELPRESDELLVLGPESPYGPGSLVGRFYSTPGTAIRILGAQELARTLQKGDRPRHVVVPEAARADLLAPDVRCRELYRSVPAFLDRVPGIRPADRWRVLRCEPLK